MKKSTLLMALLGLGLIFAPVKKSEAGIVIIASGAATGGALTSGYILAGFGAVAVAGAIKIKAEAPGGAYDLSGFFAAMIGLPGIIMLTLDADGSLSQDQVALSLSKEYPFIENPDVINHLAFLVKEKAGSSIAANENRLVSLSRDEVMEALSALDLTGLETEVEAMIVDLQ
jgi:hypothetical protein